MNDHDSRSIENELRPFVERIRLKINEFLFVYTIKNTPILKILLTLRLQFQSIKNLQWNLLITSLIMSSLN